MSVTSPLGAAATPSPNDRAPAHRRDLQPGPARGRTAFDLEAGLVERVVRPRESDLARGRPVAVRPLGAIGIDCGVVASSAFENVVPAVLNAATR